MTGKNEDKPVLLQWFRVFIPFLILTLPFVTAIPSVNAETAPLDPELTEADKAKFDEILTPVMKIYNFIKYAASLIAVIFLLFAGISYMTSGNDIRKRDVAKNMAAYVLIGLVVIWGAPFAVNLLIV